VSFCVFIFSGGLKCFIFLSLVVTSILQAKKEYSKLVMEHPEIVGTDLSLDKKAIILYVTPQYRGNVPDRIMGYPLETYVMEHYRPLLDNPAASEEPWTVVVDRKRRYRPLVAGISLGHQKVTAGTLGSIVFDNRDNRALCLSNNHVLAAVTTKEKQNAAIGDPILQPGVIDHGAIRDRIGSLHRFVPLDTVNDNLVDAALSTMTVDAYDAIIGETNADLIQVTETAPAKYGIKVQKFGRTSGWSYGKILGVDAHIDVNMSRSGEKTATWMRFVDQISVSMKGQPGDSGALLMDEDYRAIGLVAAGEIGFFGSKILCNKINNVTNLLDVHFAYKP
jgi:hypothetical protein